MWWQIRNVLVSGGDDMPIDNIRMRVTSFPVKMKM